MKERDDSLCQEQTNALGLSDNQSVHLKTKFQKWWRNILNTKFLTRIDLEMKLPCHRKISDLDGISADISNASESFGLKSAFVRKVFHHRHGSSGTSSGRKVTVSLHKAPIRCSGFTMGISTNNWPNFEKSHFFKMELNLSLISYGCNELFINLDTIVLARFMVSNPVTFISAKAYGMTWSACSNSRYKYSSLCLRTFLFFESQSNSSFILAIMRLLHSVLSSIVPLREKHLLLPAFSIIWGATRAKTILSYPLLFA